MKNVIDKNAQGTIITENQALVEKREKDQLLPHVTNNEDVSFLYKVIANNNILKFAVYITKDFNFEEDEVKFAFNIVMEK